MKQQSDSRMEFKYFAFISYNSKDVEWGKAMQRKLEHYRLPSTMCSEHGWDRTPIKPVFFAPTDIQPGGLTEEIRERLRASRHLIVICSPNSAQSEWVGKEIQFFYDLGRLKQIHFFIVDGIPNSGSVETECFNPVIQKLNIPEILGANINERNYRLSYLNKERAYIQLISKLLGLEFDALWQRHKRLLRQQVTAIAMGALLLIFLWVFTVKAITPFTGEVSVKEVTAINADLPDYDGGIMTLYVGEDVLIDTISHESSKGVFKRIPKRYKNKEARITFRHPLYLTADTLVQLRNECMIQIRRNSDVYGKLRFRLWNMSKEEPVMNCHVIISNSSFRADSVSDSDGFVEFSIPIINQSTFYKVGADIPLETDIVYMPCGEDDVILTR